MHQSRLKRLSRRMTPKQIAARADRIERRRRNSNPDEQFWVAKERWQWFSRALDTAFGIKNSAERRPAYVD